jgi:hypothetical protein
MLELVDSVSPTKEVAVDRIDYLRKEGWGEEVFLMVVAVLVRVLVGPLTTELPSLLGILPAGDPVCSLELIQLQSELSVHQVALLGFPENHLLAADLPFCDPD